MAGQLQKIAISTLGTRGDIQPYIALALDLQKAGYTVMILTCSNHKSFVEEFGLTVSPCLLDAEAVMKDGPGFKAMTKGDVISFLRLLAKSSEDAAEDNIVAWSAAMEDFAPDLHVAGSLTDYLFVLTAYVLKIPSIRVLLQGLLANPKRMPLGLPNVPCCGLNGVIINKFLFAPLFRTWLKSFEPVTEKIYGTKLTDVYTFSDYLEDARGEGPFPRLIAQGRLLADVLYPEAPPSWKFCGQLIIPSDQQCKHAQEKESCFGGGDTIQLIENFMKADATPPVYIGWGSMVSRSPEFMIQLLVQALMHCGQRAVVLGGWAKLSMELLEEATQDEQMIKYAKHKVLFVESAPHEWLFPKCACTVHHGGAGTFGAVLRAGVPMVITPCFLDQHDHSYAVRRLGCGVGFKKTLGKTTAVELGDAIRKCVSDPGVVRRSQEVCKQICSDGGAPVVVKSIEEFWEQSVQTGEFNKAVSQAIR